MSERTATSPIKQEPESLLAVDVGTVSTRVALFDVVESQYRLLGVTTAPTTAEFPFLDVSEGIHHAVETLGTIVARSLLDDKGSLILPSRPDGNGVDVAVLSFSLTADVRTALVGLLPEYSLRSVRNLARSAPVRVAAEVSLGDGQSEESLLDVLIRARPDLIVIAGGTEGGASQALLQTLEVVGLSVHLFSVDTRPQILFVGNGEVADRVRELLKDVGAVYVGPNVRPSLEIESIDGSRTELNHRVVELLRTKISGLDEPLSWTAGALTPGALGIGTIVRFLGQAYEGSKGVLAASIGAGSTILAASFGPTVDLSVRPDLNLGRETVGLLEHCALEEIVRWLPVDLSDDHVRDYLYNKSLYPRSVPATVEDLWIEQAVARQLLRVAVQAAAPSWHLRRARPWPALLPLLEPILGAGSVLARAPRAGQAALMLLDGLEPAGITTLVLDAHGLLPLLGAAARVNPLAVVQVLSSSSFPSLGTVVAPAGRGRQGETAMRYTLAYESGRQVRGQVLAGSIEVLPLPMGEKARLAVQPSRRFDLGLGGAGHGGTITVSGGLVGVILDARGRPLVLPAEREKQRHAQEEWLMQIGA
jgi:hypothetical protein